MSRSRQSLWVGLTDQHARGEWAEDGGDMNVFVPGLMGAGILISGAILVADGVRHLLPSRGVRRRLNVMRGVRRIVVDLADAAGIEIAERNLIHRRARSRWLYLSVAMGAVALAVIAARWGFNAFNSSGSSLEGNAMAVFYGLVVAASVGSAGLVALALAAVGPQSRVLRWVVAHTVYGRLSGPPVGVVERAQLLIPDLNKGVDP